MSNPEENCPSPYDLEPMCFTVKPSTAVEHARSVVAQMKLPADSVRVALALVIPNQENPQKILYGRRDPQFHTEYKDTWGLPSVGLTIDEFLESENNPNTISAFLQRISERKLGGSPLTYDRPVAWTGRIRLNKTDPQFASDYYLIMVDVKTQPQDPQSIPKRSAAYSEFQWLTPEEHTTIIKQTPTQACGACSELASLASRLGKL